MTIAWVFLHGINGLRNTCTARHNFWSVQSCAPTQKLSCEDSVGHDSPVDCIVATGQVLGHHIHTAFGFFTCDAGTQVAMHLHHVLNNLSRRVLVKVEWEVNRSSLACLTSIHTRGLGSLTNEIYALKKMLLWNTAHLHMIWSFYSTAHISSN